MNQINQSPMQTKIPLGPPLVPGYQIQTAYNPLGKKQHTAKRMEPRIAYQEMNMNQELLTNK
jgi:hypothetical protein